MNEDLVLKLEKSEIGRSTLCCKNCIFYTNEMAGEEGKPAQGICRRNPPKVFPIQITNSLGGRGINWLSPWPSTEENLFCGEFNPRPELQE